MKNLERNHWIDAAKALPIGASRRIYHGAERRPNLVIWNQADKWSAYCHSCHESDAVRKEFALPPVPVIRHAGRDNPGRCSSLAPLTAWPDVPVKEIVLFLQQKGVHLQMLEKFKPRWSHNDLRIVLNIEGVELGRTMSAHVKSKWYTYTTGTEFLSVGSATAPTVVVVEDTFSLAKLHWYSNPDETEVICALGTRLSNTALTKLINRHVRMCFDADAAGVEAADILRRRLNLLGIQNSTVFPDRGKDPKDMPPEWCRKVCTL